MKKLFKWAIVPVIAAIAFVEFSSFTGDAEGPVVDGCPTATQCCVANQKNDVKACVCSASGEIFGGGESAGWHLGLKNTCSSGDQYWCNAFSCSTQQTGINTCPQH